MDPIIYEILSITASSVVLVLIPLILLALFLVKRNGFYVSVNCWFCNSWTKVQYSDRNSFICPFCMQYNGFNEDGGYNKVIKAQFDTSINRHSNNSKPVQSSSNGLCFYCNNNQQLKVRQLADFIPLNKKNYDLEVEHFRTQLEKSYKLCKKCDKVVKKTIEKQNAWIFGSRIKDLRKCSPKLKKPDEIKTSFAVELVRYLVILLSLIVFCQAVNNQINYAEIKIMDYVPNILSPYTVLFSHSYHILTNISGMFVNITSHKLDLQMMGSLIMRMTKNDLLTIKCIGLVLEFFLLYLQPKIVLWQINEIFSWIILVVTSLNIFQGDYIYIHILQMFCSIAVIYSLTVNKQEQKKQSKKTKYILKKLNNSADKLESSDAEDFWEQSSSSFKSKNSFMENSCRSSGDYYEATRYQGYPQNFVFQSNLQNTANLKANFHTARSTKNSSVFNTSFKNGSLGSSGDELHNSLENLHVSFPSTKLSTFSGSSSIRPIISPAKLKNITQNPWTAGGFWKDNIAGYSASTDVSNLSRSSSQTSGFVSNHNEPLVSNRNSFPFSKAPSGFGSVRSESPHHFQPISPNCQLTNSFSLDRPQCMSDINQLYYKTDNNVFYPVSQQNSMPFMQRNHICTHFENSFSNLSLKSFNANSNGFTSPAMFGEKPVTSSLFKNLPGVTSQIYIFKPPDFSQNMK